MVCNFDVAFAHCSVRDQSETIGARTSLETLIALQVALHSYLNFNEFSGKWK